MVSRAAKIARRLPVLSGQKISINVCSANAPSKKMINRHSWRSMKGIITAHNYNNNMSFSDGILGWMNNAPEKAELKIAVIGGGTGSFTLLNALKDQTDELTEIVNMVDDGGS